MQANAYQQKKNVCWILLHFGIGWSICEGHRHLPCICWIYKTRSLLWPLRSVSGPATWVALSGRLSHRWL